eukprot:ctg_6532.g858
MAAGGGADAAACKSGSRCMEGDGGRGARWGGLAEWRRRGVR